MEETEQFAAAEDVAQRGLRYTKEQWDQLMGQTEDYVRANPTQAILYSAAAGFILNQLPLGRIIGGLMRLLLFSFKPAILVYGAMKLYQAAQSED